MAFAPSLVAGTAENEPPNVPIGVRGAPAMTTSFMVSSCPAGVLHRIRCAAKGSSRAGGAGGRRRRRHCLPYVNLNLCSVNCLLRPAMPELKVGSDGKEGRSHGVVSQSYEGPAKAQ